MKFQLHFDGFSYGKYSVRLFNIPKNVVKYQSLLITAGFCVLETSVISVVAGIEFTTASVPIMVKNTFTNDLVPAAYRYTVSAFQVNGQLPSQVAQIFHNQNCTQSLESELPLAPLYKNLPTSSYFCSPWHFVAAEIIYPLTAGEFNISIVDNNCFAELTNRACQLVHELRSSTSDSLFNTVVDTKLGYGIALGTIVGGALVYGFFRLNRPRQQPIPAINNPDTSRTHSLSCQPD